MSQDLGLLMGLLLGYPKCCIQAFLTKKGLSTWHYTSGFISCVGCEGTDFQVLLGRDITAGEPAGFHEFIDESDMSFESGLKIYSELGQAGFFIDCWDASYKPLTFDDIVLD
jgi:hypothetical protein